MKLHCWGLVITKIPQATYIIRVLLRKKIWIVKNINLTDIYKMLYEINTLFIGEENHRHQAWTDKILLDEKFLKPHTPIFVITSEALS